MLLFSRRFLLLIKNIPVSFVSNVLFPTDGNPIIPTLASPAFDTSNPYPPTAPFLPPEG
jgi:hypothetical protein